MVTSFFLRCDSGCWAGQELLMNSRAGFNCRRSMMSSRVSASAVAVSAMAAHPESARAAR